MEDTTTPDPITKTLLDALEQVKSATQVLAIVEAFVPAAQLACPLLRSAIADLGALRLLLANEDYIPVEVIPPEPYVADTEIVDPPAPPPPNGQYLMILRREGNTTTRIPVETMAQLVARKGGV